MLWILLTLHMLFILILGYYKNVYLIVLESICRDLPYM